MRLLGGEGALVLSVDGSLSLLGEAGGDGAGHDSLGELGVEAVMRDESASSDSTGDGRRSIDQASTSAEVSSSSLSQSSRKPEKRGGVDREEEG